MTADAPRCGWCERVVERPFIHVEELFAPGHAVGYIENYFCSHDHVKKWIDQLLADLAKVGDSDDVWP